MSPARATYACGQSLLFIKGNGYIRADHVISLIGATTYWATYDTMSEVGRMSQRESQRLLDS